MIIVGQSYLNYSTTNVTSGTWVQLNILDGAGQSLSGGLSGVSGNPCYTDGFPASGMPVDAVAESVFDSSGQAMLFGIGPSSGAVKQIGFIPPGGDSSLVGQIISRGSKVWLKAQGASATGGFCMINFSHGHR